MAFPLFQGHIDLAHNYWKRLVCLGDSVVDATCGNGRDTAFLAALLGNTGTLWAIDRQDEAIRATCQHLEESLPSSARPHMHYLCQCHSVLPIDIGMRSLRLVVYNLGYLPGSGNKSFTTTFETTLASMRSAAALVMPGGAISITCYPGHEAGKVEEEAVLQCAMSFDRTMWSCCHHRWINRSRSPSLLWIQRAVA